MADPHYVKLSALATSVADQELPGEAGEDRPGHAAAPSRFTLATGWLQARLAHRRAHAAIIVVTLLLSAPVLWVGIGSDDYFQVASLDPDVALRGVKRAPWDLYSFAKDRTNNLALREEGIWPWWTNPEVVISFFRPLSSLTRWFDMQAWPRSTVLMQLHSLAWFTALLVVVSRLYRRLVPVAWIAALAFFAFASDEARAPTVAWLCNRNALVSLTFGFAALLAHVRARGGLTTNARPDASSASTLLPSREQPSASRREAWLAPLWLAIALLGGETALQVCGYLLAYALILDGGTRAERLRSLLPYALVLVVWAVFYKLLGYGAHGSGFYSDPVRDPLLFAQQLPERLAIYALALFGGMSTDWLDVLPLLGINSRPYLLLTALVFCSGLFLSLRPLYRNDPLVRFWIVGAFLSALPACGVRPTDRMLTATAVGGMALVATLVGTLVERRYPGRSCTLLSVYVWYLAGINLVVAPFMRPYLTTLQNDFDRLVAHADSSIPSDPSVRDQTVVLLNPPWDTFAIFTLLRRQAFGTPLPAHYRWVATGLCDLRVERIDDHSLKVTPSLGFLANTTQQVLRSLDAPLHVGERIALEGTSFEVLTLTDDGRPNDILVRFDQQLEDANLRILQWRGHGYVPFRAPPVGQAVVIPAVDIASVLRGI